MLKHTPAATLLVTLFLIGCTRDASQDATKKPLAFNDFENVDGWLADSPALATLSRDKAHSGIYSTAVSPGHEFSLGYNNALSRLAPDWPAKLTVSAWVLLPDDQAAAQLVTEVKQANSQAPGLLWQSIDLVNTVKVYGKWQHVEQAVAMPAGAKPGSRLLVYLWRANSKQPVYLDDLQITLGSK